MIVEIKGGSVAAFLTSRAYLAALLAFSMLGIALSLFHIWAKQKNEVFPSFSALSVATQFLRMISAWNNSKIEVY